MQKVVWDVSMSLDGFIADSNDGLGKLFSWYFSGDTPSSFSYSNPKDSPYSRFRLSKEDAEYFDETSNEMGAMVAGRRTYDSTNGWKGTYFIHVPIFVLTHEPPSEAPTGATRFTFVTDGIESAVSQAKAVAKDKAVGLLGASIAKQCIEAGLLDELRVHIVPILLGSGIRLFDDGGVPVMLKRTMVMESSSGTTHIHYQVARG